MPPPYDYLFDYAFVMVGPSELLLTASARSPYSGTLVGSMKSMDWRFAPVPPRA